MDVFDLRQRVIHDYSSYIRSFFTIRDPRIDALVRDELDGGLLWPDPLLQLSPSFEPGESLADLIAAGDLHPETARIFAFKSEDGTIRAPLRLHRHQVDGIRAARAGHSYVLTTGTGSGKSLSYIAPIVDHVLRAPRTPSVKAIVVYPMNALANSQLGELERYLGRGYPRGQPPVTFRRYTGQEDATERQQILESPPDILLTNYMMLELLLTRPWDAQLILQARDLRFLVFDELHTYRGRQGADVAMLVRRVRDACGSPDVIHVGTSATLATDGSWDAQRRAVAEVASTIFGVTVHPEHVIGETLRRAAPARDLAAPAFRAELAAAISSGALPGPDDGVAFLAHPLTTWIESTLGVRDDATTGRLVRARPMTVRDAAASLADHTGLDADTCLDALSRTLLAGSRSHDANGRPLLGFRLHQFISRGDAVYASPGPEAERDLTLRNQRYVPGTDRTRVYLPLAFCRECGQEYYVVRRREGDDGRFVFEPRELGDRFEADGAEPGYLHLSTDDPWPGPEALDALVERLPDSWLEPGRGGQGLVPRRSIRDRLPRIVMVSPDGVEGSGDLRAAYFPAPFLLCLHCQVTYGAHQTSDFAKLATLGSEGRSTATTLLTMSTVRRLRRDTELDAEARKLLSFTDNRQDASLQAGHFNDFVEISLLRAALLRAIGNAGAEGLQHDQLARRTFDALALPLELYAINPAVEYLQRENTDRALRDVVGYYIYRDLQRGWRITSPNLEQAGLLAIDYLSLTAFCHDARWSQRHPALAAAAPAERERVCRVLLDYMRRELAIRVSYLDPVDQEQLKLASGQLLVAPWTLEDQTRLERSKILYPRSRGGDPSQPFHVFLSARGGFGGYLKRPGVLPGGPALRTEDLTQIIQHLLELLVVPGLVHEVDPPRRAGDAAGYQLNASAFVWRLGNAERAAHDPIRIPNAPDTGLRANPFFREFYQQDTDDLKRLRAKEHTAQVDGAERERREESFRSGRLPILFCSPTMELGVDIAQLNVVNMRNVPPTPANYAQRSGRAGRSGQPAFIFTYCSAGSPHDQYFFRRPAAMVSGAVSAPRIDLENEELLRSHVHAVWLAVSNLSLGSSLRDVLDVIGDTPTLTVQPAIAAKLADATIRARAHARARQALGETIAAQLAPGDTVDAWFDRVLRELPGRFEQACERWRTLYRSALRQMSRQSRIIADASRDARDRELARRLRNEAEAQRDLLIDSSDDRQSDFYSYRYFAGEGFLPGYNFPRLPLSAYLPARRRARHAKDDFVSRPRFLAISEFGPRSFIYHEGSRYVVNKVILPIDGDEHRLKRRASICEGCGYLHELGDEPEPDLCTSCGAALAPALDNLFRMQNVSTRRRDRINSDEEERFRLGYELRTTVRFALRHGVPSVRTATLAGDPDGPGEPRVVLQYGAAATLWRMNLGWRRRKKREVRGYVLDVERGYWARNQETDDEPDAPDDPMSARVERVVPYVEDTRNVLVVRPGSGLDAGQMASLEAALKLAIQVLFQLEDREIGSEPLPSSDDRRTLLYYEASEGGAGVLRQLAEDPAALPAVARQALELLHFDPDTGADLGHPLGTDERCEAACYDCLLSYYNQRDHRLIDRHRVAALLLDWSRQAADVSPAPIPRPEHVERLSRGSQTDLERRWLQLVDQRGHRLPDHAQAALEAPRCRPDFLYAADAVAIFVDGPHHDAPDQRAADRALDDQLSDHGITAIRFHHADDWRAILDRYPAVFGPAQAAEATPVAAAPAAPAPAPTFDPDDYDERWHAHLQSLSLAPDLHIAPGEEVMRAGRAIDLDLATVRRGDRAVRLVDLDAPQARAVAAALEEQGHRVVRVRADMPDVVARVLAALEG